MHEQIAFMQSVNMFCKWIVKGSVEMDVRVCCKWIVKGSVEMDVRVCFTIAIDGTRVVPEIRGKVQ